MGCRLDMADSRRQAGLGAPVPARGQRLARGLDAFGNTAVTGKAVLRPRLSVSDGPTSSD